MWLLIHAGIKGAISYLREVTYLYPRPTKLEGGILDSPCPSVRPSVCRRHGFRSISQVCFGISISNFISRLMVVIGRIYWFSATSLSKWPPSGHIEFLGFQTLTLVWLWISTSNFSDTILMYMGRSLMIFSNVIFKIAAWWPYLIFRFLDSVGGMVSGVQVKFALEFQFQTSYACCWWS